MVAPLQYRCLQNIYHRGSVMHVNNRTTQHSLYCWHMFYNYALFFLDKYTFVVRKKAKKKSLVHNIYGLEIEYRFYFEVMDVDIPKYQ